MSPRKLEGTRDPEIKLDAFSGKYYYRGTPVPGRGEKIKALGVSTFGLAVTEKKRFLIQTRGLDPRASRSTFSDLALAFESLYQKKFDAGEISKSQLNKVKAALKSLRSFFSVYKLDHLNEDFFRDFVAAKREENPTRKLENDTVTLNMMMIYAHEKGLIPRVVTFKNPDPYRPKRRPLEEWETKKLFQAAKMDLRVFMTIALTMGMRPMEILSLAWRDVDLKAGRLTIQAEKNKNRKSRTIAISPDALRRLRAWRRLHPKLDHVFPSRFKAVEHLKSIDGPFARAVRAAGVSDDLVPYNLRHTFCTTAARRIRSGQTTIVHVCRYCDHDITTFNEWYLHLTPDDTMVVAQLVEAPL